MTFTAVLSAAAFLVGVWLVFAPRVLQYRGSDVGGVAFWNDVIIGGVVAAASLVRYLRPWRLPVLSWISVGLGGWLLLAPFVLGHAWRQGAGEAVANDMIAGSLVIAFAGASGLRTLRSRRNTP